ncbi:MAG: hypothetical protein QG641_409 [Candidatus Poribacteria bacterium]|nr:hypothetical protein [Candidatus Poribacteria bacterium]
MKKISFLQLTRRDFIKTAFLAGIGISQIAGCAIKSANTAFTMKQPIDGATVVIIKSENLAKPDRAIIKQMLDMAVPEALGVQSPDVAWKMLFKPTDTVGIKVNCIASLIPTHPELSYAIADSLIGIGVPPEQIIIWDRDDRELTTSGYKINADGPGIKCYGTKPRFGYGEELVVSRSVGSRISKILSRQCSALVNVPVLKDHNIAGLSMSLKNYFGAIENPNKFHGNNCDPYVADLYMSQHIKEKSKLIICDAINVLFEGGPTDYKPRFAWNYNGLIIGTDPVAIDQIALILLEEKRASAGLPPLASVGRPVKYITTAADPEHRLGIKDPEKIRVIELSDNNRS